MPRNVYHHWIRDSSTGLARSCDHCFKRIIWDGETVTAWQKKRDAFMDEHKACVKPKRAKMKSSS